MQKIKLGFSPCPNDTFIFNALVHKQIDTEGLEFEYLMADVEELNGIAFRNEADMIKVSFFAYLNMVSNYVLLDSGSALGNNCGPLLISKKDYSLDDVDELRIAIPGRNTTANLLLSIAAPNASSKVEMLFSDVEKAVLDGEVDAGLIIHENRFTYTQRGLKKIADLGEYWEETTQSPIPLGGIVVKRNLDDDLKQKLNRILRRSVEYAFNNPDSASDFIRKNAQEMDEDLVSNDPLKFSDKKKYKDRLKEYQAIIKKLDLRK